jgi:hypothetical protein
MDDPVMLTKPVTVKFTMLLLKYLRQPSFPGKLPLGKRGQFALLELFPRGRSSFNGSSALRDPGTTWLGGLAVRG